MYSYIIKFTYGKVFLFYGKNITGGKNEKKRQRNKVHGFRARMKTQGGRNVVKRRRNRGRAKLSA